MPYDTILAGRIREHLREIPGLKVEEKKMFRGLTFMVHGKMCVCVSGENLMCRFDPGLHDEIAREKGFQPMIMNGKEFSGYCYVGPDGIKTRKSLEFWIGLCLDFNNRAKSSKKRN